ncbi:MAG: hypothetical protein ACJ8GN_29990 [Longimicrobiaceae bacterium]
MPDREVRPTRGAGTEAPIKKNFRLHQSKIDRAMELLGTRTETETIERALEIVAFRHALVEGTRAMRGAELNDVFEGSWSTNTLGPPGLR